MTGYSYTSGRMTDGTFIIDNESVEIDTLDQLRDRVRQDTGTVPPWLTTLDPSEYVDVEEDVDGRMLLIEGREIDPPVEISRTRVGTDSLHLDVVITRHPEGLLLTLEGDGTVSLDGDMPGEYWLRPVSSRDVAEWAVRKAGAPLTAENVQKLLDVAEHSDVDLAHDHDAALGLAADLWPQTDPQEAIA